MQTLRFSRKHLYTIITWSLAVAIFGFLFLSRNIPFFEPDFFMHLRVGQWILENRTIPRNDVFSLIAKGSAWMDHEWLFQVILYAMQHALGWFGLSMVRCTLLTLSFIVLWRTCRLVGIPQIPALLLTLIAGSMTIVSSEFRPQVFTYLLLPVCILITYRHFKGLTGPIWLLPFIVIFWANVHGAFVAFFAFAGIFLAGEIAKFICARWGWPISSVAPFPVIRNYAVAVSIAALAGCLNPYGIGLYTFPFKVIQHQIFFAFIFEWMPPSFPFNVSFWLIIGAIIAVLASVWKHVDLTHVLILIFWTYLSLSARRNATLFTYVAIPLFGLYLWKLVELASSRLATKWLRRRVFEGIGIVLMVAWAALELTEARKLGKILRQAGGSGISKTVPVETADFILREHPAGNMYNEYNVGGYLIYRLYSDYLVYQDGRIDLYGPAAFRDYKMVECGSPRWKLAVQEHDLNLMVLTYGTLGTESGLMSQLDESSDWSMVHWDDNCVVYVKTEGPNSALAKRLGYHYIKPSRPHERLIVSKDEATSALPEIDRALSSNTTCIRALQLKIECLALLERFDEARDVTKRLQEIEPSTSKWHLVQGRIAMARRNFADAAKEFHAAVDADQDDWEAWDLLGRSLEEEKKKPDALVAYEKAVHMSPYRAGILPDVARISSSLGRFGNSARYWNQFLELRPYDLMGLNDAAVVQVRLDNNLAAISLLQRAIEVNPKSPAPYYNLAWIYTRMGDTTRAFGYLEEAVKNGGDTIRQVAKEDTDLDALRNDPRFTAITAIAETSSTVSTSAGTTSTLASKAP